MDSNGDALEKKSITRSSTEEAGVSTKKSWWADLMSESDQLDDMHFGNKMVLLMDILKECALIGDKVRSCQSRKMILKSPFLILYF